MDILYTRTVRLILTLLQPKPILVKTDSTEDSVLSSFGGLPGTMVSFTTGDGKT